MLRILFDKSTPPKKNHNILISLFPFSKKVCSSQKRETNLLVPKKIKKFARPKKRLKKFARPKKEKKVCSSQKREKSLLVPKKRMYVKEFQGSDSICLRLPMTRTLRLNLYFLLFTFPFSKSHQKVNQIDLKKYATKKTFCCCGEPIFSAKCA